MKFNHPTDIMRAKMLGIEIRCSECQHWTEAATPWCHNHKHQPIVSDDSGFIYCSDFQIPTPKDSPLHEPVPDHR
jgi:hypothetical protein